MIDMEIENYKNYQMHMNFHSCEKLLSVKSCHTIQQNKFIRLTAFRYFFFPYTKRENNFNHF